MPDRTAWPRALIEAAERRLQAAGVPPAAWRVFTAEPLEDSVAYGFEYRWPIPLHLAGVKHPSERLTPHQLGLAELAAAARAYLLALAAQSEDRHVLRAELQRLELWFLDHAEDPDRLRGVRVIDAAREGHTAVHGTAEARATRNREMQAFIDRSAAESPHWNWKRLVVETAEHFGVSEPTVRRYCHRPRT